MVLVLFLLFIAIFSYEYFKVLKFGTLLSLIFGALLYYILLYNVTYNNDWNVYEALFRGEVKSRDYLFIFISYLFISNGLSFIDVYKLYVVLIGLGFTLFIKKISLNAFFCIIGIYLLIQLVPLSNQIRYFLAFTLFLMSTYSLIVDNSRYKFIIYFIFSILSHFGIIILFTYIYFFYKVNIKNYSKVVVLVSIVNLIAYFLFANLLVPYIGFFSSYLEKSYISSFSGGLFSSFIWLFYYLFIHNIFENQSKNNELKVANDVKYLYLYKLSIYTFVFFLIGLYLQIAIHRYVASFLLIWIAFVFYSLQFEHDFRVRMKRLLLFMLLVFATYLYIYILPEFVFETSTIDSLKEILRSNKLVNFVL